MNRMPCEACLYVTSSLLMKGSHALGTSVDRKVNDIGVVFHHETYFYLVSQGPFPQKHDRLPRHMLTEEHVSCVNIISVMKLNYFSARGSVVWC